MDVKSEPDDAILQHGFRSWSRKRHNSLIETWKQIEDADKFNERYPKEAIPKPRHVALSANPQNLVK
jgi:hypothetical protein